VKNKRCEFDGCNKQPAFNYEGKTKGKYCNEHKEPTMVNVKDKRCDFDGCNKRPFYGLPGKSSSHCATHKKEYQINNPTKKCIIKKCKELAIYNNTEKKPKRCEAHKLDNDINLIERHCEKCGLLNVLNEHNTCTYCDPKKFLGFRLGKQLEVKSWLDRNNYTYESYDEALLYTECDLKSRPDFVFDCVGYKIVLEVDEYAHTNNNESCECTRMVNISQAFRSPTIFIRYNPDHYNVTLKNGTKKRFDPSKNKRFIELKNWLEHLLKLDVETINLYGYCSMVQLFYNEYSKSKVKPITITPFEK
jgi:hypothetical protein